MRLGRDRHTYMVEKGSRRKTKESMEDLRKRWEVEREGEKGRYVEEEGTQENTKRGWRQHRKGDRN